MFNFSRMLIIFVLFGTLGLLSGCGLLIGNIKPVDEKSEDFKIIDLATTDSQWLKLDTTLESKVTPSEDISDVGFQSKKTSSIISLNTGCRRNPNLQNQSLEEFSNLLFLGISDIELKEQSQTQIHGVPALQTTVRGKLANEPTMVRAVVLKHKDCFYDLMYVSKPKHFESELNDFARFAASLRLK